MSHPTMKNVRREKQELKQQSWSAERSAVWVDPAGWTWVALVNEGDQCTCDLHRGSCLMEKVKDVEN